MKKIALTLLLLLSFILLLGCEQERFEIALITMDHGHEDRFITEAVWNSTVSFASTHKKTYAYYEPLSNSFQNTLVAVDLAISKGASIVILPGDVFANTAYKAQTLYPDVNFILINTSSHNVQAFNDVTNTFKTIDSEPISQVVKENLSVITFDEQDLGFLAGYGAMMDGYRELGFLGNATLLSSINYGIGYVLGAYYGAYQLGLTDYTYNYHHYDYIEQKNDNLITLQADQWYTDGVELIFSASPGSLNPIVTATLEDENRLIIGSDDSDIHNISDNIIASAVKKVASFIEQQLSNHFNLSDSSRNDIVHQSLSNQGIGLNTDEDAWGFKEFSLTDYQAMVDLLVDQSIIVPKLELDFSENHFVIDELIADLRDFVESLGYHLPVDLVKRIMKIDIPASRGMSIDYLMGIE